MMQSTTRAVLAAALIGLGMAAIAPATEAQAQELRVIRGEFGAPIEVPLNRAIIVESDVPFAELSIANPQIADINTLSDRTVYVLGKAPGSTTLTLLGLDGALISSVTVRVSPDVAEFKERLGQILPGENVEVRTANDGIVLSGTVSSIAKLDRALELAERYAPDRVSNLMNVGGSQQVMLKVRFAEMSRSVSKNIATNLDFGYSGDNISVGGTGFNDLDEAPSGRFGAGFNIGGAEFSLMIDALENKGVVRTLAEPNLTALSGQQASFLAGGEVPIPVNAEDNKVTVDYKKFGVEMTFTPRVVDRDLINLELQTAVSEIDPAASYDLGLIRIPGFSKRETITTVQMRDGESFAIAGLLSEGYQDTVAQVPFIGDLPVLGALFRSSGFQKDQTELVVIITAHLVSPARGEAYALPTDNLIVPTERELFLFGRSEGGGSYGGAVAEVAGQKLPGSYGYVLD